MESVTFALVIELSLTVTGLGLSSTATHTCQRSEQNISVYPSPMVIEMSDKITQNKWKVSENKYAPQKHVRVVDVQP
jgi:hypothetical protein